MADGRWQGFSSCCCKAANGMADVIDDQPTPNILRLRNLTALTDRVTEANKFNVTDANNIEIYKRNVDAQSTIGIPDIISAVILVINENIEVNKIGTPQLVSKDGNIMQGDTFVLKKETLELITEDLVHGNGYDQCGDKCSNVIAYIQYYVALACRCVSVSPKGLKDKSCADDLHTYASDDFEIETLKLVDEYRSQVFGSNYNIKINFNNDGCIKLFKHDILEMSIELLNYRSDRIRHICFICAYYYTVCALQDKADKTTCNTNLSRIIECWKKPASTPPNVSLLQTSHR
jgi:hypothetical protein